MEEIGIREVQVNLTKLLRRLPFAITRYGEVIAIVMKPKEEVTVRKKVTVKPLEDEFHPVPKPK